MAKTKIEWATHTWNPVTGCSPVSEGCRNCYAERMSKRLSGRYGYPKDEPFRVTLHEDRLDEPLKWRKPRMVFVCSMGDLFHEDIPFDYIDKVFAVTALCPHHTFLILTKRPKRMAKYFYNYEKHEDRLGRITTVMQDEFGWINPEDASGVAPPGSILPKWPEWPLSSVWLGVTAENQEMADERIPVLLQVPAAKRFISVEPMLGAVNIDQAMYGKEKRVGMNWFGFTDGFGYEALLHWVICGGETGAGARPMHPDWAGSLKDQCQYAGVPFFFKSWGDWLPCCGPLDDSAQEAIIAMDGEVSELFDGFEYRENGREWWRVERVGKKAAGRLLDGREWNETPGEREG